MVVAGADPETGAALDALERWIEAEEFRGWDPHDALRSPLLRRLTFGDRRLGVLWLQLLKRSPVNLRPLLGVRKGTNPKSVGLFLSSYLRRWWLTGSDADRERALGFAEWLRENVSGGYAGACWGYDFDWPNRGFFAPAGTPTIVNTAFNGLALLEAGDLATARSACEFVLRDLRREEAAADELCFSYTPIDERWIHNANVLGARLLAEVAAQTGETELRELAMRAARFTARRQEADGSWKYGTGPRDGWVDNFHTGYVLVALERIGSALETDELDLVVRRGYRFWMERLMRPDGWARYYPDREYPADAHASAQAILTYLALERIEPDAIELATRAARTVIRTMQEPEGWFDYQVHRAYRIRIPYMRWSQAWMQRALRELSWVAAGRPGGAPILESRI